MRSANVSRQSFAPYIQPENTLRRLVRKGVDTWLLWQRRADDRRRLMEMAPHLWRYVVVDRLLLEKEAQKPFWRA